MPVIRPMQRAIQPVTQLIFRHQNEPGALKLLGAGSCYSSARARPISPGRRWRARWSSLPAMAPVTRPT